MGACTSNRMNADFRVSVATGDRRGAGMDANVHIAFIDTAGALSPDFTLDNKCKNDFERAKTDTFYLTLPRDSPRLREIKAIRFWRDDKGVASAWYVEHVAVRDMRAGTDHEFPIHRWVKPFAKYSIVEYDTTLPQLDTDPDQRLTFLKDKREIYELEVKDSLLPIQVKTMPEDEKFSWDYKWDITKLKAKLLLRSKLVNLFSAEWESLSQLKNVYTRHTLPEPRGASQWRDDLCFARQRTHGCSIGLIKLCTAIPDKLGVTDEMLAPLLQGSTIAQAIAARRLFMTDLEILVGLTKKEECHICTPIALFFENKDKKLTPIAIQLEQQASADNPVFLPSDPEYTWLMAKMWYNNADAMFHQSCTHLGFTHLLMEGVCVSANRHLSQSHPLFKLLAPHFLYLIAINSRGIEKLISIGGWVDKTMSCGVSGMFDLINRGTSQWRVDVEGTLPESMCQKGLADGALIDYPYRDDGLLVYGIIRNYVSKTINHYYDTPAKLSGDWELQAWGKELTLAKEQGGVGLKGVPGGGTFVTNDQVITLVACIVSTCSIGHSASNFPQYDEYAFPPNYPGLLRGTPPTTKDPLAEKDILYALPDKGTTLDIMVVTKILSERATKSLSDFEVTYVFDPPAKQFVREFREELAQAQTTVDERNRTRDPQYTILHPKCIPNSISI